MALIRLTNVESWEIVRLGLKAKYGDRFAGCSIKRAATDYLQWDITEPEITEVKQNIQNIVITDDELVNGTGRKILPLSDLVGAASVEEDDAT